MSVADGLSENAANVILATCTGGDEQLWKLEDKGSGFYWVRNKNSQKCLDLEKTKKSNFQSVMQWECHNVSQHKFCFLCHEIPVIIPSNVGIAMQTSL